MHLTYDLMNQANWLNDFCMLIVIQLILSLTTNLFCIFEICWVPTAVLLVKNDVLLLVPTGNVLELPFSKCFLIKAWLGVKRLFPVWCNTRKNIGKDQKPRCSSCMAIESHNLKILEFLLYGYHIPQLPQFWTTTNPLNVFFWS